MYPTRVPGYPGTLGYMYTRVGISRGGQLGPKCRVCIPGTRVPGTRVQDPGRIPRSTRILPGVGYPGVGLY
eukprot:3591688-Rhodomonas_salina.2